MRRPRCEHGRDDRSAHAAVRRAARQRPRPAPGGPVTASAVAAGIVAAGAGLLVIAVVVIIVWAASLRGGAGAADALRAVAQVWLLAHRVSLHVPAARSR